MSDTVLTKLQIPAAEAELVQRPRLAQLLDDGLQRKVTVVSAPAGYGKTTGVAMWARSLVAAPSGSPRGDSRPRAKVAWYSLDAGDDDVSTFFIRFAAAINAVLPGAFQTDATGLTVRPPPINEYANTLADACNRLPEPVVLVLDDYHLIGDEGIHAIILYLIRYASARLHLVIVTRHDPPLRVSQLRVQGQVAEVRGSDLRLTDQEAKKFLELRMAQRPPAEFIAALQARTEGWAAGLQLAAAAVQGRDDLDAFIEEFQRHGNVFVMDYLFDEALERQPEDVKTFLLVTALLARFNVSLAAQVAGLDRAACRRILDYLRQENLFIVPLDSRGDWHRYHHQFQAMLADRVRGMFLPDEINAIRASAAGWLAAHGWPDAALTEYLAAERWDQAADLVEAGRCDLQNREEWQVLRQRIARLPEEVVARRPGLLLGRAWLLQAHDRLAAIPPVVEQAEMLLAGGDSRAASALRGEIHALRGSWVFPKTSADQRLEHLRQALQLLPARKYAWVRGFVYIQLAAHLAGQGQSDLAHRQILQEIESSGPGEEVYLTRLHHALAATAYTDGAASELLQAGLRYRQLATMSEMPMALAWANFAIGWAHYLRAELAPAMEALLAVFDRPYSAHTECMTLALAALTPVAAGLGRVAEASRLIDQVGRIALERENLAAADELSALSAYAALLQGDRRTALAWAERSIRTGFRAVGGQRRAPEASLRAPVLARIALADGANELIREAIALLEAHVKAWQAQGHAVFIVQGAVLLACCCWRIGSADAALRAMQLAVELGWPRGFRGPFYEQPADVAAILRAMTERDVSANVASMLLAEAAMWQANARDNARAAIPVSDPAITPLSERETEVLALLAQRLTNKEIARRLDLSPLTVRNHASSIYSKLAVSTRKQAVAQAQRTGLLPPDPATLPPSDSARRR